MKRNSTLLGIFLSIFLSFAFNASATSTASIEIRTGVSTEKPAELAQFNYLIGNWNAEIHYRTENGEFAKMNELANVKAFFHQDNRTLQTIFTMPSGFFSTDIRTFNKEQNHWSILFLNATDQRWHRFSAQVKDGKMVTLVKNGFSGKESFDVKSIATVKSNTEYLSDVYHSHDNGKTWVKQYVLKYSKIN